MWKQKKVAKIPKAWYLKILHYVLKQSGITLMRDKLEYTEYLGMVVIAMYEQIWP